MLHFVGVWGLQKLGEEAIGEVDTSEHRGISHIIPPIIMFSYIKR